MQGRTKAWLWIGLALAVVGGSAGLAVQNQAQKRQAEAAAKHRPPLEFAPGDLVQVALQPLAVELVLPGTVQAVSQATVRAKLSAEVRRVLVREGDRVTAGQVLAEFDTAQLKVQLAERTAALESARAQLAQSERTRQANAQLVRQSFISQNAFDTADAAYRAQAAAAEAAQAQLAQTQLLLADAVVRAPLGGYVARRFVQPGEKVAFDAPLLSIVDLARLEVHAQAPVSDVARIARGAVADIEIEGFGERRFAGRVERISPSAEPGTRTIQVYVGLTNDDALLRAGMFARVRLSTSDGRPVPTLPLSAIRVEAGQTVVWVLGEGRLQRRVVAPGRRDERAQRVEILDGVSADERVVATRFDNLRDGLAARVLGGLTPGGSQRLADEDSPRPSGRAN